RPGHASEHTVLDSRKEDETGLEIPVALIATALPASEGVVLVIEDLSELITAQRASAWQEVARRMAHEIKNPLTPIQLSAERIARCFRSENGRNGDPDAHRKIALHDTDDQTVAVIREGTETIIREVNSLKSMVDEFSRFARLPKAEPLPGNLNENIEKVLELYRGRPDEIVFETEL